MQQRYYDPLIGQHFLSVDPVTAYSPGGAFNQYWYANANPYRFTDPDGRQSRGTAKACDNPVYECGSLGNTTAGSASTGNASTSQRNTSNHGETKGAVTSAVGNGSAGLSTAALVADGAVTVTRVGELTPEAANVLKISAKFAKASSVVSGGLAIDEIVAGDTNLDRGHGALNLTITVGGAIACGASGVCAAAVAVYGIIDAGVQFKEYTDPQTGVHYSGWSAFYKDATD